MSHDNPASRALFGRPVAPDAAVGALSVPRVGGREQQWSGKEVVAAGDEFVIIDLSLEDRETLFVLDLSSTGGPFEVTAIKSYDIGFKSVRSQISPLGGAKLPINGGTKVTVENLGASQGTIRWSCLRKSTSNLLTPQVQDTVDVEDDAGGVGAWVDVGWVAVDRAIVDVFATGAVDLQFVDSAGTAIAGPWALSGPQSFQHPPMAKLQARHPGGVVSTRTVLASWRSVGS